MNNDRVQVSPQEKKAYHMDDKTMDAEVVDYVMAHLISKWPMIDIHNFTQHSLEKDN